MTKEFNRREALKTGAAVIAGAGMLGAGFAPFDAAAQTMDLKPESGASLRILRPAKFVQGDETLFLANAKKYEAATGVKVRVDSESWEDLRPKSSVAANVGRGPDVIYGWFDDAHLYPEKLVELTDVAEYLGKKYGGWFPAAERFGKKDGKWICIPLGGSGSTMNYRISWAKEAGFETFPSDLAGFLKLCQALHKNGHPPGMALGNATGDANGWTHWCLWAHGGRLTNDKDQVTIDSPATEAALNYAKQLYATFIPGTLSWLDPSNNKAFLSGEIGLTNNGISVYYAAKTSTDPKMQELAKDINHGPMPVGVSGKPTELATIVPAMVFKYSKFPNAAKDFIRFMLEREQYEPWMDASIGYWGHPLAAYDSLKIWTVDPKHQPYANVIKNSLWPSFDGSLGAASAGCLADFIVVNMFASVCAGQRTPKEAMAEAAKRAKRYYDV